MQPTEQRPAFEAAALKHAANHFIAEQLIFALK
jgi:hypothetical protein